MRLNLTILKKIKLVVKLSFVVCLTFFGSCQFITEKQSTANVADEQLNNLIDEFSKKLNEVNLSDSISKKVNSVKNDCPDEGNAIPEHIRELNILKNRIQIPQENNFDLSITLQKMLEAGNDVNRWSNKKAVKIKAFVYDIKPGGVETCNCKSKEANQKDAHIELLLDPNNSSKNKRVVAEVTPRIRDIMNLNGINWSTRSLRDKYLGRFVEIEGWLLFDIEHKNAAENTNPGRQKNWRATSWEIHPITSIKLLDKNPNLFQK